MTATPRFSVVIPHYDATISDALFLRGFASLASQTFRDFEVLLYHDGPLSRPLPDLSRFTLPPVRFGASKQRYGDWGHSLRHQGILAARGDYVVHFNPDNVLYPEALAELDAAARRVPDPAVPAEHHDNPDVLVFAILLKGELYDGRSSFRNHANPASSAVVLSGIPPVAGYLDAMQVVVRRTVWLDLGGWYDRSYASDGVIYEALIRERGARYVPRILGEHW